MFIHQSQSLSGSWSVCPSALAVMCSVFITFLSPSLARDHEGPRGHVLSSLTLLSSQVLRAWSTVNACQIVEVYPDDLSPLILRASIGKCWLRGTPCCFACVMITCGNASIVLFITGCLWPVFKLLRHSCFPWEINCFLVWNESRR